MMAMKMCIFKMICAYAHLKGYSCASPMWFRHFSVTTREAALTVFIFRDSSTLISRRRSARFFSFVVARCMEDILLMTRRRDWRSSVPIYPTRRQLTNYLRHRSPFRSHWRRQRPIPHGHRGRPSRSRNGETCSLGSATGLTVMSFDAAELATGDRRYEDGDKYQSLNPRRLHWATEMLRHIDGSENTDFNE